MLLSIKCNNSHKSLINKFLLFHIKFTPKVMFEKPTAAN